MLHLSYLMSIALSIKAWIYISSFPDIPLFQGFTLPPLIENSVVVLLILSITYDMFKPARWRLLFIIGITIVVIIDNYNCFQPWLYFFILIYILKYLSSVGNKGRDFFLPLLRILLISVYLWAGLNKLNSNFMEFGGPMMFSFFFSETFDDMPNLISLVIPFGEIALAALLACNIRRMFVVAHSLILHTLILLYVSPLNPDNLNVVVIPWNLFMIYLTIILSTHESRSSLKKLQYSIVSVSFILLTICFPVLNTFGWGNNTMSFNLYSARGSYYYISYTDEVKDRLDQSNYNLPDSRLDSNLKGGDLISINEWSMNTLNIPVVQSNFTKRAILNQLCPYSVNPESFYFIEAHKPYSRIKLSKDFHMSQCD